MTSKQLLAMLTLLQVLTILNHVRSMYYTCCAWCWPQLERGGP
jgi:hypothetical protein